MVVVCLFVSFFYESFWCCCCLSSFCGNWLHTKTCKNSLPRQRNGETTKIPDRPEFQLVRNGWLRRVIGSVSLPDTDRLELRIVWNLGSSGKGDKDFKFGRSGIYYLCEWLKSGYRAGYTSGRSGNFCERNGRSGISGRPGFGYCVLTSATVVQSEAGCGGAPRSESADHPHTK